MSTTYESAFKWIEEKNPTTEEIQTVLTKLETRIETFDGSEDKIQGSIEAAEFLQAHLSSISNPKLEERDISLDPSPLIPDLTPITLEKSIKEKTFAALKAQLGKQF